MDDLFSPLHLVILLVIVLLIFGPKRLPELGSGIGKSIRGFRDGISGATTTEEAPQAPVVNQAAVPTSPADASNQALPPQNRAV